MKFDLFAAAVAGAAFLTYISLWFFANRGGKGKAAVRFSGLRMLERAGSSRRVEFRRILIVLRIAAVIALLIAFARPRKGLETVVSSREGIAVQMVIDRSSSMGRPMEYKGRKLSRLEVVKLVLEEFVKGNGKDLRGRRSDMIGLIGFAGFPEENSPLTLDHTTLVDFAKTIETASRAEDGTMIGDALYFSVLKLVAVDELLKKAGEKDKEYKIKSKIVILLTDGQQSEGGTSPAKAAEFARDNNIKVYTIAIIDDSLSIGDRLFGGFFSFKAPPSDTSLLERAASLTGGIFAKASSGESLKKIYREIDQLEKSSFEERFTIYKEQFPFWLYVGLLLLSIETILSATLFCKIP